MTKFTKLAFIFSITSIMFVGCEEQGDTGTKVSLEEVNVTVALKTTNLTILEVINKARAEARDCFDGHGVVGPSVALTWNGDLYASAYEHSNDLATSDTFSHMGSGTASDITGSNNGGASLFNERIKANGYVDYEIIGENIAGGKDSIESALEAWLESPAHCANIMEKEFTEIGVAVVVNLDSTYRIYWTQNFGGK
jgi:uncharacterized protein YkwD